MSDISHELRQRAQDYREPDSIGPVLVEAASEIEALQATVADLQQKRIDAAVEGSDWKARALRAEAIVERLPQLVGIVATDCGATNDDRPSLYRRGNVWRYHVRRCGNEWADDADPIKSAEKAKSTLTTTP